MLKRILGSISYLRRIAIALESMERMYAADLRERGVVIGEPGLKDEVEVLYGERAEEIR
jgi:hypothetical protein